MMETSAPLSEIELLCLNTKLIFFTVGLRNVCGSWSKLVVSVKLNWNLSWLSVISHSHTGVMPSFPTMEMKQLLQRSKSSEIEDFTKHQLRLFLRTKGLHLPLPKVTLHSMPQVGSGTRSNFAALLFTWADGCCFSVKLITWDRTSHRYDYTSSSTQVSLDTLMYHYIAYSTERPNVELIYFIIIHFESDLLSPLGWLPPWKKNICMGM